MTAIWDEAFLKQRERDAREMALAEQSDNDWESADLLLDRAMSDSSGGHLDCPLPACRRARRCVGNKPICMPRCAVELVPGGEQEVFEQFYAEIQEERRDAAAEGRAPDVERVMKHRVHVEEEVEEQAEDASAPPPACDEAEPSSRPAVEAPRSAPSQPVPQPQLHTPEPPAAVPVPPAAKAPPPEPEPRSPTDVEERVNRIWAEYEASPEAFSARRRGPRIRLL